jgi:putative hydrolase of the HAD superfamily
VERPAQTADDARVSDHAAGSESDTAEISARYSLAGALVIDLDDTLIDAKRTRAEAFAAVDRLAARQFGTEPGAIVEHADSVLGDSWRGAPFSQAFNRLGCAATDALWVDFDGPGALLAEIRRWMPGFRERFWTALCARAGAWQPADYPSLGEAFVEERRSRIRTFPGVRDALLELRARFPLVLLTNGPGDLQRLKLRRTDMERCFDAVIVSAEAGVAKPRREIFAMACDAVGSSPGRTVMVGDDLQLDVLGAQNAGLLAILVRTGSPDVRASGPEAALAGTPVVDRFAELPRLWRGR